MILGIGTDLLEISRMEKALERESFSLRVFTEEERRQARGRVSFLAGCFAVKEAVAKCFGTGFSEGIAPDQIEVLRDERGCPFARLHGAALARFRDLGGTGIHVSISDTRTLVTAMAVLEGGERHDGGEGNPDS